MAAYVPEPVHLDDLESLITDNWDAKNTCEVPEPFIITTDALYFDPSEQWGCTPYRAVVNIQLGEMVETQDGYAAEAVKQVLPITFDIWTLREGCVEGAVAGGTGRQYLHDVKAELRRIAFTNKHSLVNWQRVIYNGFKEIYEDSISRRFHGQMKWTLCNAGVNTPTEELDNDLFDRTDGVIGSEWTNVVGTWNVICCQARLSTNTPNAITRFTGPCCCTWPTSVRVNVCITTVACVDAGIAFRWTDACNYWKATLEESCCTQYVRLTNVCCGVETQLGEVVGCSSGVPTWTAGNTRMLEVELYRTNILVHVNGLTVIHVASTLCQTSRNYGLYSNSCTGVRFDCFRLNVSGGSGR